MAGWLAGWVLGGWLAGFWVLAGWLVGWLVWVRVIGFDIYIVVADSDRANHLVAYKSSLNLL